MDIPHFIYPVDFNNIIASYFASKSEFTWEQWRTLQLGKCAAAAAKLLQSCLTLCDPIDSSPPGSIIHGIFQARILEWGAIAFSEGGGGGPLPP